ncbi:RidA family protein [Paenibacillus sp. J2TS4]|uniref:RidA family protein n=1 Tax=Paenibacillus sp. J2TS4 TaxID=2807194 RepID=UPI0020BDC2A2|nr:Rid family detoxifying hydrolase [Paenibacillus sp. J2TS4]
MRDAVRSDKASKGDGPYSQGIVSGGFVFVSGQGPLDSVTGAVLGQTVEEQTEYTLQNIIHILEAAGCSMNDVVKVNVILSDLQNFAAFNEVYRRHFSEPMPARTCFGGQLDGILVEIDVIAKIPE